MAKQISNMYKTLFYLKRHLSGLEAQIKPQHEAMAHQGLPYSDRQKALAELDKLNDGTKAEREVFKELIEFLES